MTLEEKTDVLIIGAAIAGIRAAIEAFENGVEVILPTKGALCKDVAGREAAERAREPPPPDINKADLERLSQNIMSPMKAMKGKRREKQGARV